jgi:hypothetical protein
MIPVQLEDNPNCIHTPASCVEWTYGSIPYLGICNGDMLPKIIWEIVNKLQEIAGADLSSFDIDTLLDICNQKAPLEKNLTSILELLKNNQVCLKNYIDTLNETLQELSQAQSINVNLKCLADFDNFGNQLSVTRETLDQLVIDKLCNHETRITTVEGKVTSLQSQINDISVNPIVSEPEFATCVDATVKPTSGQVVSIATEVCDIRTKLGPNTTTSNLTTGSFGNKGSYWNTSLLNAAFGATSGWIPSPLNEVEYQRNMYIILANFQTRINEIETNCCAPTCDKIMIGFSVVVEDAETGDYVVRFRPSDGTSLFGFVSTGSQITFTGTLLIGGITATAGPFPIDINETDWDDNVYNLSSFDLSKPITVNLTPIMIKNGLTCQKCISQVISLNMGCAVCELTASGDKGDAGTITITYQYE